MFKIVKRYYETSRYTKEDVATFVRAGRITAEQYKEITGDEYAEDR